MIQKKTKIRLFLSVAFILGAISIVISPQQSQIVSPRLTMPVILLPGAEFNIALQHSAALVFAVWQVQLLNKEGGSADSNVYDLTLIEDSSGFGTSTLRVKLPATIPAGRYTLALSQQGHENTATALYRDNAVHVREQFSENISIIQLADLPTLGGDGSGDKRLEAIIEEVNIINPDVVLFSGDLAYGGRWDQYERLIKLLKKFHAPVIAVPGNHAYYGWAGYLSLLGKPYHQISLGNYQFISLNSGHGRDQLTHSQLGWFANAVRQTDTKYRIVQLHHPIQHRQDLSGYLRANRQAVLKIIIDSGVGIVLSGHWHGDSVYDINGQERTDTKKIDGPPFVVTTTAGADFRPAYSSSELHYGYRLIRFVNGVLENYTYDYDGDGVRDASSSIPLGKLNVKPRGRYGVVATNQLNEGFLNARVKVRIPDATSTYNPNRGKIVGLERNNGESIYTIQLDLPANQETPISMVLEGYND